MKIGEFKTHEENLQVEEMITIYILAFSRLSCMSINVF
jgi:hypothetical protein